MTILRTMKREAASSKDPEKGMMINGTQASDPDRRVRLTIPRFRTRNGIVGIATSDKNCAAAVQKPIVASETPKLRWYQVGRSSTMMPKPKPEMPKVRENFA